MEVSFQSNCTFAALLVFGCQMGCLAISRERQHRRHVTSLPVNHTIALFLPVGLRGSSWTERRICLTAGDGCDLRAYRDYEQRRLKGCKPSLVLQLRLSCPIEWVVVMAGVCSRCTDLHMNDVKEQKGKNLPLSCLTGQTNLRLLCPSINMLYPKPLVEGSDYVLRPLNIWIRCDIR